MPVNHEMPTARARGFGARRLSDDNRVALGGTEPRLQTNPLAVLHDPLRAGPQILAVLRLGGNAGESHILAELSNGARLVLFQVIKDSLHPGLCNRERSKSKGKFDGGENVRNTRTERWPKRCTRGSDYCLCKLHNK